MLRQTRGFTLVEMAIVMVVIGLLLSGGLFTAASVIRGSEIKDTNKKFDMIEQALIAYAIQHSCLPCPATYNGTGTSAWGTVVSNCETAACAQADGVLPWVTLGISRLDATDAWGNRIRYSVTAELVAADAMERNGTDYGDPGTLNVNNDAGGVVTSDAAYVLVSHGPNGGYAYNGQSGVLKPGTAAYLNEAENGDADNTYVQDDLTGVEGANFFDDLVRWRSKPLMIQLCGAGACGNPS